MNRRRGRWECKEMKVCSHGLKQGLFDEHIRELTKALLRAYTDLNEHVQNEKRLFEIEKFKINNGQDDAQNEIEQEAS